MPVFLLNVNLALAFLEVDLIHRGEFVVVPELPPQEEDREPRNKDVGGDDPWPFPCHEAFVALQKEGVRLN